MSGNPQQRPAPLDGLDEGFGMPNVESLLQRRNRVTWEVDPLGGTPPMPESRNANSTSSAGTTGTTGTTGTSYKRREIEHAKELEAHAEAHMHNPPVWTTAAAAAAPAYAMKTKSSRSKARAKPGQKGARAAEAVPGPTPADSPPRPNSRQGRGFGQGQALSFISAPCIVCRRHSEFLCATDAPDDYYCVGCGGRHFPELSFDNNKVASWDALFDLSTRPKRKKELPNHAIGLPGPMLTAKKTLTFAFSDTHDGAYRHIKQCLLGRGWQQVPLTARNGKSGEGKHADFTWTIRDQDIDFARLGPTQATNHTQGNSVITTKRGLCATMGEQASWVGSIDHLETTPRSYNLSDQAECMDFEDDFIRTAALSVLRIHVSEVVAIEASRPMLELCLDICNHWLEDTFSHWRTTAHAGPTNAADRQSSAATDAAAEEAMEFVAGVCGEGEEGEEGEGGEEGEEGDDGEGSEGEGMDEDGEFEVFFTNPKFDRRVELNVGCSSRDRDREECLGGGARISELLSPVEREGLLLFSRYAGTAAAVALTPAGAANFTPGALNQRLQHNVKTAIGKLAHEITERAKQNQPGFMGFGTEYRPPATAIAAALRLKDEDLDDAYDRRYLEHMCQPGPMAKTGSASSSIYIYVAEGGEARRMLRPRERVAYRLEVLLLTGLRERESERYKDLATAAATTSVAAAAAGAGPMGHDMERQGKGPWRPVNTKSRDSRAEHERLHSLHESWVERQRLAYARTVEAARRTVAVCEQGLPQFHIDGVRNLWVLKPHSASGGVGIEVSDNLAVLLATASRAQSGPGTGRVVQKYVENPLVMTSHSSVSGQANASRRGGSGSGAEGAVAHEEWAVGQVRAEGSRAWSHPADDGQGSDDEDGGGRRREPWIVRTRRFYKKFEDVSKPWLPLPEPTQGSSAWSARFPGAFPWSDGTLPQAHLRPPQARPQRPLRVDPGYSHVRTCPYAPAPLDGRGVKFDLRWWVLVTSWAPLRAHLYSECYGRLCSVPFTLTNAENPLAHLTNYSQQKKKLQFDLEGKGEETDSGLGSGFGLGRGAHAPRSPARPSSARPSSAKRRRPGASSPAREAATPKAAAYICSEAQIISHLDSQLGHGQGQRLWSYAIRPAVARIVASTLRAAQCQMEAPGLRPRSFELLGFDILLDETFRPWLLEVNLSPGIAYRGEGHNAMVESMLAGVLDRTAHVWFEFAQGGGADGKAQAGSGNGGNGGSSGGGGAAGRGGDKSEGGAAGGGTGGGGSGRWLLVVADGDPVVEAGAASVRSSIDESKLVVDGFGAGPDAGARGGAGGGHVRTGEQRLRDWAKHVLGPHSWHTAAVAIQRWWRTALHLHKSVVRVMFAMRKYVLRWRLAVREDAITGIQRLWRSRRVGRRYQASHIMARFVDRNHGFWNGKRHKAASHIQRHHRAKAPRKQYEAILSLKSKWRPVRARCTILNFLRVQVIRQHRVRNRWASVFRRLVAVREAQYRHTVNSAAAAIQQCWRLSFKRVDAKALLMRLRLVQRQKDHINAQRVAEFEAQVCTETVEAAESASPHILTSFEVLGLQYFNPLLDQRDAEVDWQEHHHHHQAVAAARHEEHAAARRNEQAARRKADDLRVAAVREAAKLLKTEQEKRRQQQRDAAPETAASVSASASRQGTRSRPSTASDSGSRTAGGTRQRKGGDARSNSQNSSTTTFGYQAETRRTRKAKAKPSAGKGEGGEGHGETAPVLGGGTFGKGARGSAPGERPRERGPLEGSTGRRQAERERAQAASKPSRPEVALFDMERLEQQYMRRSAAAKQAFGRDKSRETKRSERGKARQQGKPAKHMAKQGYQGMIYYDDPGSDDENESIGYNGFNGFDQEPNRTRAPRRPPRPTPHASSSDAAAGPVVGLADRVANSAAEYLTGERIEAERAPRGRKKSKPKSRPAKPKIRPASAPAAADSPNNTWGGAADAGVLWFDYDGTTPAPGVGW